MCLAFSTLSPPYHYQSSTVADSPSLSSRRPLGKTIFSQNRIRQKKTFYHKIDGYKYKYIVLRKAPLSLQVDTSGWCSWTIVPIVGGDGSVHDLSGQALFPADSKPFSLHTVLLLSQLSLYSFSDKGSHIRISRVMQCSPPISLLCFHPYSLRHPQSFSCHAHYSMVNLSQTTLRLPLCFPIFNSP